MSALQTDVLWVHYRQTHMTIIFPSSCKVPCLGGWLIAARKGMDENSQSWVERTELSLVIFHSYATLVLGYYNPTCVADWTLANSRSPASGFQCLKCPKARAQRGVCQSREIIYPLHPAAWVPFPASAMESPFQKLGTSPKKGAVRARPTTSVTEGKWLGCYAKETVSPLPWQPRSYIAPTELNCCWSFSLA